MKSLLRLIFLSICALSCSIWDKNQPSGHELMTTYSHNWFSKNPQHALQEMGGSPISHKLFDTIPQFQDDQYVNIVAATLPEGDHSYEFDLVSGQRFYSHSYCSQTDIWNNHDSRVGKPSFIVGHIPRVLDQLGKPQKVLFWGQKTKFTEVATTNYLRTKLLGAYIEQICPQGNCLGKNNWLSRLVFIGVDAEDPQLSNINSVLEFQEKFKWIQIKAILENMEGRNFIGGKFYPFLKVGDLIEFKDAFNFFKKRSIFLTDSELRKIQSACHSLYEKLWHNVGKDSLYVDQHSKDSAKVKGKKTRDKQETFSEKFIKFTHKYSRETTTCSEIIQAGNINNDPHKFWFLSYITLFYRLHRDGYYFDCSNKMWQRNYLNENAEKSHSLENSINKCDDEDFDSAMIYLPSFLKTLRNQDEYYRFIDYDNHPNGSHAKMFSWVKVKNRKFECFLDPNQDIQKSFNVFPDEAKWIPRARDIKSVKESIIR